MNKKQFLVRNVVWNKHWTGFLDFSSDLENEKKIITLASKFMENLSEDDRINYSVFSVERGRKQDSKSFHFQGYTEFSRPVDGLVFKKEFELSDVQSRKGSQSQAIDYVKKERTKILDRFFEFGIPKKLGRELKKYNTNDLDIRSDMDFQRILLNQRLKEDYYSSFTDIEKDFELLFIKNEKWCKNLWDRYHPIKKLGVLPARTIWIYGNSGIGKTTWTDKYLRENSYSDLVICKKKASNDKRPKLWFDIKDENCSVLWIEEIRNNFPDFNDIIQLIDKGTRLEVKGSHIDNNFDLIIFNSLYSPEMIYDNLYSSGHKVEILRRLHLGRESKVFELVFDEKNYNKLIDRTKEFPRVLLEHLPNISKNS